MTTCADEIPLVTPEREQKPEQHLEIAARQHHHVSVPGELMLDTARRFTEAASGPNNSARSALPKTDCQLQRLVRARAERTWYDAGCGQ
jgi:hypothetical protein